MTDLSSMFERLSAATGSSGGAASAYRPPEVTAEGASDDQSVIATMTGGRLMSVRIDAHTMRRGNAEVGDAVVQAVNAAIDEHNRLALEALAASGTDFAKLRSELSAIGEQAQRSMESNLSAMREMLDRATERASRP